MFKGIDDSNLGYLLGKLKTFFWRKNETSEMSIDNAPTSGSNNLVKSGGVYTAVAAKYTKPSGGIPASDIAAGVIPSVPAISTDVKADKASDLKTASPKAVYTEVHPAVASAQPAGGFAPNVLYTLGELAGDTTFSLATPGDADIANHYYWTFDTPATAPTITWPSGLSWVGGSAPTIAASKHYEVSVLDGVAVAVEV